jgi:hypothetical protein
MVTPDPSNLRVPEAGRQRLLLEHLRILVDHQVRVGRAREHDVRSTELGRVGIPLVAESSGVSSIQCGGSLTDFVFDPEFITILPSGVS